MDFIFSFLNLFYILFIFFFTFIFFKESGIGFKKYINYNYNYHYFLISFNDIIILSFELPSNFQNDHVLKNNFYK